MFVLLIALASHADVVERPPDKPLLTGRTVGIGLIPGPRGTILQVGEDTPAWKLGIRPEHTLVRIAGRSTRRMSEREAAGRLAVPVGTSVDLVVLAGGEEQSVSVTAAEFDGYNRTLFTPSETIDALLWCDTGTCTDGIGKAVHTTGTRYVGTFVEGLFHGYGIQDLSAEERFEGSFSAGLRDGPGVLTIDEEVAYAGTWVDGVSDGAFTVRWDSGEVYEGQLRSLAPHGTGVRSWPTGQRYTGEFDYGDFHGKGDLNMPDGQRYTGSFQNGLAHGTGKLVLKRGDVLEGTFLKGKLTGQGRREWSDNGRIYEGEFANNDPHGQGTMTWTSGDRHIGSFNEGEISGWGVRRWDSGRVGVGMWTDDNRFLGRIFDGTGAVVYEGWAIRGKAEGWGRTFKKDGTPKRDRWYFNGRNYSQHPRSRDLGREEKELFDAFDWSKANVE